MSERTGELVWGNADGGRLVAGKWLRDVDEMLDEVKAAQRRRYEELRERRIADALRRGLSTLTLTLPEGGEEVIDLRLH
jgi:hypothetical protein